MRQLARILWRSFPARVIREGSWVFDLAVISGSWVVTGAVVGAAKLWSEIGGVAQFFLALGAFGLALSAIAVVAARFMRPRGGWVSNSRLQMLADAYGHGLIMSIKGPETVEALECRVSGPGGLQLRSFDESAMGLGGSSNQATFHFPGQFKPQSDPYPPAGRYIVRWSGVISIEDEDHPFNQERVPLAREFFRIDQFGGIHTRKRDRNLNV